MNTKYEAPKLEEMVRLSDIQGRIDAAVRGEREACAKVADHYAADAMREPGATNDEYQVGMTGAALGIAAAIRARGKA